MFLPPTSNEKKYLILYPNVEKSKMFLQFIRRDDFLNNILRQNALRPFTISWPFTLSILIFIVILLCIRRRLRLPRDGVISIYIDVMAIITGGNSMEFNHKFEKFLYVTLFVVHFFLLRIYMDDFLLEAFLPPDAKSVSSFEKIAKFKLPFLLDGNIKQDNASLIEMLR